jgi:ABC-type nitrate/sulfonate/bicarbonate transport system substrate-binding protein
MKDGTTLLSLAMVFVLLMMCGCMNKEEPDYDGPVPSNAPVLHVTYEYADWSVPFFVAMKKGYFRKRAIDIKPLKVGDLPALRFSEMDVINGHAFSLMGERGASPTSIRFVHPFLYTKDGPMITGFLVKKTAQIAKWGDFKGRKSTQLALRSLGDHALIKKIMESEGVDMKGFDCACGGDPAKTFEENDAIIGVYTWGGDIQDLMKRRPNDYVLLSKNLSAEFVSDPCFVACTYINIESPRTQPEVMRRYVEAIDQAIDYIRKNPSRALSTVPKYMDFTPEAAAKLSVYHFCKSTEPIDFTAIKKSTGHDVKEYLYQSR